MPPPSVETMVMLEYGLKYMDARRLVLGARERLGLSKFDGGPGLLLDEIPSVCATQGREDDDDNSTKQQQPDETEHAETEHADDTELAEEDDSDEVYQCEEVEETEIEETGVSEEAEETEVGEEAEDADEVFYRKCMMQRINSMDKFDFVPSDFELSQCGAEEEEVVNNFHTASGFEAGDDLRMAQKNQLINTTKQADVSVVHEEQEVEWLEEVIEDEDEEAEWEEVIIEDDEEELIEEEEVVEEELHPRLKRDEAFEDEEQTPTFTRPKLRRERSSLYKGVKIKVYPEAFHRSPVLEQEEQLVPSKSRSKPQHLEVLEENMQLKKMDTFIKPPTPPIRATDTRLFSKVENIKSSGEDTTETVTETECADDLVSCIVEVPARQASDLSEVPFKMRSKDNKDKKKSKKSSSSSQQEHNKKKSKKSSHNKKSSQAEDYAVGDKKSEKHRKKKPTVMVRTEDTGNSAKPKKHSKQGSSKTLSSSTEDKKNSTSNSAEQKKYSKQGSSKTLSSRKDKPKIYQQTT